jgi:large subunit ribosomal protein L32e
MKTKKEKKVKPKEEVEQKIQKAEQKNKKILEKKEEKKALEERKESSAEKPKEEKKVKEKIIKIKIKPSKEIKKIREKLKRKKKPLFRGRFGKRNWIRSIHKEKWQKWRKPRGIDSIHRKEDGAVPKIGYGTNKNLRFRHPSGYFETIVRNVNDLEKIAAQNQVMAARIARTVGKRKRIEIIKKANELKIKVLN